MGAFISCCLGTNHLICCSLISILGAMFFFVMFLALKFQPQFLEFRINRLQDSRGAVLLSMGLYLGFFALCVLILVMRFRKQRVVQEKNGYRVLDEESNKYRNIVSVE